MAGRSTARGEAAVSEMMEKLALTRTLAAKPGPLCGSDAPSSLYANVSRPLQCLEGQGLGLCGGTC